MYFFGKEIFAVLPVNIYLLSALLPAHRSFGFVVVHGTAVHVVFEGDDAYRHKIALRQQLYVFMSSA